MRRGSAWIQALGAIHPRLCEGPLLGHTLTVLTGQTEPTQDAPAETNRPGNARFDRWKSPLQPDRNATTKGNPGVPRSGTAAPIQPAVTKYKAFKATPAGSSAQALFRIKTQADRLLLSKLAGGELAFEKTLPVQTNAFSAPAKRSEVLFPSGYENLTKQQDWLSRLAQRAGRAAITTGEAKFTDNNAQMPSFLAQGKSSEAFPPPGDRDSATQQDWLNRLAQRAGRAGIQKQPNRTGTAKLARDDAPIPDHLRSLQEQWAMPLNGMCASRELLKRLVQDDLPDRESDSGRAGQYQPQPLKPNGFSAGGYGESLIGGNKLKTNAPPPMTAQAGFPELNRHEQLAPGESKTTATAPIIPSDVTVSLPNLQSPQPIDRQPLPVAAATVRQSARTEELNAADDLDMLAAKINQILNEQARRHGIDV